MQNALRVGAHQRNTQMGQSSDWAPLTTAPKDGTIIEIRCTYGVAPWYGIYSWIDGKWSRFGVLGNGICGGDSFTWRPLTVKPEEYVDPTGGLRDSPAYWRGAVCAAVGLPLDHFEAEAHDHTFQMYGTPIIPDAARGDLAGFPADDPVPPARRNNRTDLKKKAKAFLSKIF